MGLQRVPYVGFKGVNYRDSPYELEPDEAMDCLNVQPIDLTELRGLKKRSGRSTHATFSGNDDGVQNGIYWAQQNVHLMSRSGDVYWVSAGGGTPTLLFNSAQTREWEFVIGRGSDNIERVWMQNGTEAKKWDGTTLADWANSPPLFATNVAFAGAMVYWRGMVVIAKGGTSSPNERHRVFFSDVGNPESPATSYGTRWVDFYEPRTDNQGIMALLVHQDKLYVFTKYSVWLVYENIPPFSNRRIASPGCAYRYAVLSHPGGRMWWASEVDQHLYSSDGSFGCVRESERLQGDPDIINHVSGGGTRLEFDPHTNNVMWSDANGSTGWDKLYEVIPRAPGDAAIFPHQMPSSGRAMWVGSSGGNRHDLIIGSSSATSFPGRTWTWDTASAGLGDAPNTGSTAVAIDAYWWTAWRSFLSEEPLERVRRMHAIYGIGGPSALQLELWSRLAPANINGISAADFTINLSGAGGSGGFREPFPRQFSNHRPERRGRYHMVRIRDNSTGSFDLDKIEFAIRGGKEHA